MKTWKNLIVPAVILAILVAGLVIYNYALKDRLDPQADTTDTSAVGEYIFSYEPGDIADIKVLKSDGSGYSVYSSGPAADGSVVWGYDSDSEDLSGYHFSQTNLSAFVSIMSKFETVEFITDKKDTLSEYGLDKPAYSLTYTLSSGETHTVFIGNQSYDGSTVYCTLDNSGIIATTYVIKAKTCEAALIDFLDLAITSFIETDVAGVSFKRAEDNLDLDVAGQLVLTADGSSSEFGWQVQSPFNIEASTTFGTLMDSVLGLSATSYAELKTDDFSKYGLDQPAYTFDISLTNGKKLQIMLSGDMGGIYYGVTTESPAVFILGTSALTGLQTPLIELIDPYLSYEFIADVSHVEAVFHEGSFSMDMSVARGAKIADPESIVSVNGIPAKITDSSKRSYFAVLYEAIVCMNISDFDFDTEPINTNDISVEITRRDGSQIIISLAEKDENTYYAFIDGEYHGFLVSKEEVYRDNGTNLYDYGAWAAYERLMEAIDGDDGSGIYVISDS